MHTKQELFEHYKAVRARINQAKVVEAKPIDKPTAKIIRFPVIKRSNYSEIKSVKTKAVEATMDVAARAFDTSIIDLKSKSRLQHISLARQVVMFVLNKELGISTPRIGILLAGKDHSTVVHATKKIKEKIDSGDQRIIGLVKDINMAIEYSSSSYWG